MTTTLLSPSFAPLHWSAAKEELQCNIAFFAMLRCKAQRILWSCSAKQLHKQTNKIDKEKKSKMLTWVPLRLQPLPCSKLATPSSCSKLPSKLPCSKLAPARRL
jgi:hypothetical protein